MNTRIFLAPFLLLSLSCSNAFPMSASRAMAYTGAALLGAAGATGLTYCLSGKKINPKRVPLDFRYAPHWYNLETYKRYEQRKRKREATATCAVLTFLPAICLGTIFHTQTGAFALRRCIRPLRNAERALFDAKISVKAITRRPVATWARDCHNNYAELMGNVFKKGDKFVENPLAPLMITYRALEQQECDLRSAKTELISALKDYNSAKQRISKVSSPDADMHREMYDLVNLEEHNIREELETIRAYENYATETRHLLQEHPDYLKALRLERLNTLIILEEKTLKATREARDSADRAAFWAMATFLTRD